MSNSGKISSVCVFCGSAPGNRRVFMEAAEKTGRVLAQHNYRLVYGGGKTGLMGGIADAALRAGGVACGVMPQHLVEREIAHEGLSELVIVETMHERKAKMSALLDGFLVLPGGSGTLEEAFEQWTWAQIDVHKKPIGILNVEGYFNPMISMIDSMVNAGFINPAYKKMLVVEEDPTLLLHRFKTYVPPRWKSYENFKK